MDDPRIRPVRTAIAHDDPIVTAGFAALLAHEDHVKVIDVHDGASPLGRVDVLLLDPAQEAATAVDISALTHRGVKVLAFTWDLSSAATRSAVLAGACGAVWKGSNAQQLTAAISQAAAGQRVYACDGRSGGAWPGGREGLSRVESEVLGLIAQGLSNHEVARRRQVSINTIKSTVRALYRKIDVTRRSQAVAWAIEHGFPPALRDDATLLRERWLRNS
ncbi:response regulator transcription factor [Nocardioides sp. KIGAM211]|uniref:Response regulator transcription factor n=1 Tax=Nocardioides luti TaxID=2761101 RepID=A0A7X0RK33_9ACTN|nr:response regulator transcription factor [Nocardioides luti]MBB6629767.1 response regulator transcription factor [Nocardioides luti]